MSNTCIWLIIMSIITFVILAGVLLYNLLDHVIAGVLLRFSIPLYLFSCTKFNEDVVVPWHLTVHRKASSLFMLLLLFRVIYYSVHYLG